MNLAVSFSGRILMRYLLAAFFVLVLGQALLASIWVGKITDNRQTQWETAGQWAVIEGDNSKLRISWDAEMRAYYIVIEGSNLAAGTDGRIPPMTVQWGGAANQVWVKTRWVN